MHTNTAPVDATGCSDLLGTPGLCSLPFVPSNSSTNEFHATLC